MTSADAHIPVSYERYAIDVTSDLIRQLITVIETMPAEGPEQEQLRHFNVNRAYSALGQLQRIHV